MPWKVTTTMEQKVEFICERLHKSTPSQNFAESLKSQGQWCAK